MKQFLHILSYPVSAVFYLCFGFCIVVFHPIQWVCYNLFGYQAHKKSVDILNWFLMRCLNVLGTRFSFKINTEIPNNVPIIIVSNHQSMWDIPPIIWFLRKYHPKFISKIELGKGIPSISYNLRKSGAVLIDRKNPEQALLQIKKIGIYANNNNRSVVIFPEGSRSRDGMPKPFKPKGLNILFSTMKDGYVLPVSLSNSWRLQRHGMFPIPLGVHLKFVVNSAIKISDFSSEMLIAEVEKIICSGIDND